MIFLKKNLWIIPATGGMVGVFCIWFFYGSLHPCDIAKRQALQSIEEVIGEKDLHLGRKALYLQAELAFNDLLSPAQCFSQIARGVWTGQKNPVKENTKPAVPKKGVPVDAETLFEEAL